MELHRGMDMGKRCVQIVQILSGVQPVSEHVCAGTDRCGQILCHKISYERDEHR